MSVVRFYLRNSFAKVRLICEIRNSRSIFVRFSDTKQKQHHPSYISRVCFVEYNGNGFVYMSFFVYLCGVFRKPVSV